MEEPPVSPTARGTFVGRWHPYILLFIIPLSTTLVLYLLSILVTHSAIPAHHTSLPGVSPTVIFMFMALLVFFVLLVMLPLSGVSARFSIQVSTIVAIIFYNKEASVVVHGLLSWVMVWDA
ncbi:hypothetical protein K488DRAFT_91049 [Vararia minispora EC-137]|uniref:Uncharacterized protein n=1 Tax=Vararia minispora EC-137 TaxID=1314806 RepID=A0ACB8Q675_9AGAM|nr:hypothetical protein K488DRAFT_91049 [Vararia minispora EC-137]